MTVLDTHPRWRAAGRLLILILGIGLTTWGICLIAFPNATNISRLGLPIAAWGVLLGYWSIRVPAGRRRHPADHLNPVEDAHPDQDTRRRQDDQGQDAQRGRDVVVERAVLAERAAGAELVRERDEAIRREFELSLEVMLRRELEQGLRQELSGLRRDVAELRGDVLDVVDGRLRMERVEITRIIGSNLAALQHDSRRIALNSAERADVSVPVAIAAAPIVDAPVAAPAPALVADPPANGPKQPVESPETEPPEPVRSETARMESARPTSMPDPPLSADPFAGLPRLSSFRMPELPEPPLEQSLEPAALASAAGAGSPDGHRYVGRRRHHAADDADAPTAGPPGRHGAGRNTLSPFDPATGPRSTTNHHG